MMALVRSALALIVVALLAPAGVRAAAPPVGLTVAAGFIIERIATVEQARELAVAPNGDLFVGTYGRDVVVIAGAEATAAAPKVFVHLDDGAAAGIAIDGQRMILGSQFGIWELPYQSGDRAPRAVPRKLAAVRTSGSARGHSTTSVAVAKGTLFASVGSSCNACDPELDPTRASIQRVPLEGGAIAPAAQHIRNAIALAANPATGTLWAGVAGQDELAHGHPYEIFDAVTLHSGVVDYGWPHCYENRKSVDGRDCSAVAVPRVVFPAYETPIGAVFYPLAPTGAHAFPAPYRGGAFVTLHGSWHTPPVPPRIVFVPMHGDEPQTPVDWSDPSHQWRPFVEGFQNADGTRTARPTGIAVAPDGTLFFSEDEHGGIYRIRPR